MSNETHGKSRTSEYNAWVSMVQRCRNPRNPAWKDYGGRGITVCDEWARSFEAFYAHVGDKPMAGLAIDRIDNEKGYEPGNVRWASYKVNGRNRRNNRMVEVDGEWITLAEACERKGVKESHVVGRMWHGKGLEEAMGMPLRARGKKVWVEWEGERISLGRLAARVGVHKDTLAMRVKRGWSLGEAVSGVRAK